MTSPEELGHAAVPDMSLTENAILTGATRQGLQKHGVIDHRAARIASILVIGQIRV